MSSEEKKRERRNLEWRCLTCGATAPATGSGYMHIIRQTCPAGNKAICLVDTDTGEELANNIKQAQSLGLIPKKQKPEAKGEKAKGKKTTATRMETPLPGGESISGIVEREKDEPPEEPPAGKDEVKREGVSDEFIEGEAIWVKAKISAKSP